MVETVKTQVALLAEMADGGDNTAEEVRNGIVSMWTPGWIRQLEHRLPGDLETEGFFWGGGDLASFTEQTVSGTANWIEDGGLLSAKVNGQTADPDLAAQLIAATISIGDSWVVPIIGSMNAQVTTNGILAGGICLTDGTDPTSNVVMAHIQDEGNAAALLVGRSGTLTAASTAPWVSTSRLQTQLFAVWVKLTYLAANTFRVEFSPDGRNFSAFGEADIAKTMTPTHVGVAAYLLQAADGIVSFGPLLKT